MKNLMWLLQLVLKAAIFFTLFAFALNNQHEAMVHFFFGTSWQAPMVLVVLLAFVMGVAVGVLGMVPRWWRQHRVAHQALRDTPAEQTASRVVMNPAPEPANERANKKPSSALTSEEPPHGI